MLRAGDPRVQFGPRDAKDPAGRVHPQRPTVVLHGPVDRVAGQAVSGRQRRDVAVFDSAQATLVRGRPERAVTIEREAGHVALPEPFPGGVGGANATILEVHHAAVGPEGQPYPAIVRDHHLRTRLANGRPGDVLDHSACPQVRQSRIAREPQVARFVPGNRKHLRAGHAGHGHEPPAVEVRQSALREHPDSPARVLEQRLRRVIRQSARRPEGREPSVLPPHQPLACAEPHAAVSGPQYGHDGIGVQALSRREGRYRRLLEPIESGSRGQPDSPFAIFEETAADVAGETVRHREGVRPPAKGTDQPSSHGCDPECSIAVPQEPVRIDVGVLEWRCRTAGAANRIRLDAVVNQLLEPPVQDGNQQMSVVGLAQVADLHSGNRITLWRAGCPSPESRVRARPERAGAVLMQPQDESAEHAGHAVSSGTPAATSLHGTEVTAVVTPPADPHRPMTVLEQRRHHHFIELGDPGQAPVVPARQACKRPDPESAISCGQEFGDLSGWQLLTVGRLPPDEAHAVEVKQTELAPQPQVPVWCLGHRGDCAQRESATHRPRGVRVLAHVARRIERSRGARCEDRDGRRRGDQFHAPHSHRS